MGTSQWKFKAFLQTTYNDFKQNFLEIKPFFLKHPCLGGEHVMMLLSTLQICYVEHLYLAFWEI